MTLATAGLLDLLQRAGPAPGQGTVPVALIIGAQDSVLGFRDGHGELQISTLALGEQLLVEQIFHARFPDDLALETGIAVVEDEVMKSWPLPARHPRLVVADPGLVDVLQADGQAPAAAHLLDLDAVEVLFNRVVALSQGSPERVQGMQRDPALAARLLILRELLHHLRFEQVLLVVARASH